MSRAELPARLPVERVTDPAAVKLLLHERARKVLGCFLEPFTGAAIGHLTDAQAQDIQTEFIRLILRVKALGEANEAQRWGRPFVLRLVQTPISEDEFTLLKQLR